MDAPYQSAWVGEDRQIFRDSVRRFIEHEFVPHQARWCRQQGPDPEAWPKAGRAGLLLTDIATEYGGGGGDFTHEAVVREALTAAGVHFGSGVHAMVAHYLQAYASEMQKRRWLPAMARGDLVGAIVISEPAAGADLQGIAMAARRDGDDYVINGSKAVVTNGRHAGLLCLAVKTDPAAPGSRGLALIVVETAGLAGYRRGRPREKVGLHGQDICPLHFDDVRVPAANLLGGEEGRGFAQMRAQLPYARLGVAVDAVAAAERAVAITTRYVQEGTAFGKALIELQNARFQLAECRTEALIGRVFLDHCIHRFVEGRLDDATATTAKVWLTDCQCRIVDKCLQLQGGYDYMTEYPVARMRTDSRV